MIDLKLSKENKKRFSIKKLISVLVILVSLSVAGVSIYNSGRVDQLEESGASDIFYSAGEHLNRVIRFLGDGIGEVIHFHSNAKRLDSALAENQKLKQEIINLKSDQGKLDSLERLERSLKFIDREYKNDLVSAKVIGKNDGDWYESFVVDAGSDDGIVKNSIVVNGDGVVGIVYSVSDKYSKVLSIIDYRSSVSFKVSGRETSKGMISSNSITKNYKFTDTGKYLQGYLFDSKTEAKKNDLLVTSGLGLYPENIPIGKIQSITYDKNRSMKTVKVKPLVNFKDIDIVSIIPPRVIE